MKLRCFTKHLTSSVTSPYEWTWFLQLRGLVINYSLLIFAENWYIILSDVISRNWPIQCGLRLLILSEVIKISFLLLASLFGLTMLVL